MTSTILANPFLDTNYGQPARKVRKVRKARKARRVVRRRRK